MKRMIPALLIAVVALTACGEDEPDWAAQAKEMCLEAVANEMKDPNSTEFRDVTVEDKGPTTTNYLNDDGTRDEDVPGNYWSVEGEVNAKNGFGAMVGFRGFRCEAKKSEGRDMDTGYVNIARR
ncbi:hypothetical protein ACRAJ3_25315 [Rhodococcus pyridinivorans]|uniref:hypothetical protein n=1 Tax=Rhodococcus pyridinivorans TaxID=103816 RepID=UPI003D7F24B3